MHCIVSADNNNYSALAQLACLAFASGHPFSVGITTFIPAMKYSPSSVAVVFAALLGAVRATAAEASSVDGSQSKASLPCETGDEGTLNVHLVPHTHDDVGWLKTPHQYYYGFNNTIQNCAVKFILDTAIAALAQNPNRTFTYVEMAFFDMWWREQSDETKALVKRLVKSGQLSFVNGGWCMHDEAATHYMGMIDQTTLGHDFLLRELDYIPRVGWQLDPFGHSATQASLLSSKAGFDALYFGRIDYQDMRRRHDEQQCEGFWSASSNLESTNIFWGLTGSYDGNYGPPAGFCFDVHCDDDYLIGQDDDTVRARITELVKFLKVQSDRTKGSNIMLTMGEDFNYENSLTWYENMEKMASSLLALQASGKVDVASILAPRFDKINMFYSSPNTYTDCKFKEIWAAQNLDGPYETKTDDFFPYSDRPNGFWTGYFTSRPALKRLERVGSSFLLAARQTQALRGADAASLDVLDRAIGTAQHHDAVSGTSKQHVAYDYAKQIQAGINDAEKSVVETFRRYFVADPGLSNLALCQLRNETICNVTQRATQVPGSTIYLVVYNALAQQMDEYVTVPVAVGAKYQVSRLVKVGADEETWQDVKSAVVPNKKYAGIKASADYVLHFQAKNLPAVGAAVYQIEMVPSDKSDLLRQINLASPASLLRRMLKQNVEDQISISSGQIEAKFSNGGILTHICSASAKEGKEICQTVHQEWGYYTSFDSTKHAKSKEDTQNSGAYIFRPSDPNQELQIIGPDPSKSFVFKSDLVTEVHSSMEGDWIHQITRIYPGRDYVEIEYTVGPIPVDDVLGKEIVTRYTCPSIENGGTFYTDSNGREFMKRQRSHRPTWNLTEYQPVAGNYYPINAAIHIEDDDTSMSIAVDRSQGGGSIADGSIEIMVHRRTLVDDFRGVNEPINETDSGMTHYPPYGDAKRIGNGLVITAKHRLSLSSGKSGASKSRSLMDRAFAEPIVFASSSHKNLQFRKAEFAAIDSSFKLPENIMLITLNQIASTETSQTLLIRLGHQYGNLEDEELSKAVDIDFKDILPGYEIQSITERTLSGNQDLSEREQKRLRWNKAAEDISDAFGRGSIQDGTITIYPMEIRTFHVKVGV